MPHATRSTGRRTRARVRASAATAAYVLVLPALPSVLAAQAAEAAPQTQTDYAAPYSSSDAPVRRDCTTGASCSGTASADKGTGQGSASAAYDRSVSTTGIESVVAAAEFAQSVRLPKGTTAATVTATWRIASASASASSTRGDISAGSQLSAQVLCDGGCVTTREVRHVSPTCGAEAVGCLTLQGAELTVTTTVRDLARSSFQVVTAASAFVVGHPLCGATTSPSQPLPLTEDCSVVLDPEHAGSGRSDIAATLVGLHVDPS